MIWDDDDINDFSHDYYDNYKRSNWGYTTRNLDTKEICSNYLSEKTFDNIPIKKILIANIDRETTHKELKVRFSFYGEVVDCILKKKSGKKKSYAFITYSNSTEAKCAIIAGYKKQICFNGQWVRVIPAASWNQPDSIENQAHRSHLNKVKEEDDKTIYNLVIDENKETIHLLNNDCLIHIFNYLSIADRVRIEIVCKRWKAVCAESYCYNRTFDLNPSNWGLKEIKAPHVFKVLHKYGSYITTVDLFTYRTDLGNASLISIAKLCPNIQTININGFKHSSSAIRALADNCNNIKKLVINMNDKQKLNKKTRYAHIPEANDSYIKELSLLLAKNPNLQYFHLNCNYNDVKECLLNLPVKSIKELILDDFSNLSDVCTVVQKSLLRQLTIRDIKCFSGFISIIEALKSSSKNLRVLQLSHHYDSYDDLREYPIKLTPISELSNLIILSLERSTVVDDDFLINLSKKCKLLSKININYCICVTNNGLKCVVALPKLKVLSIDGLDNISDEVLTHIPELQTLSCASCNNIDYVGLTTLITTCEKLKKLYLCHCRLITNNFIDAALEATKYRKNTVLTLFVYGTCIDKFTESSFLKIEKYNSVLKFK